MELRQIGGFTDVLETLAGAVGAGMLLGGFEIGAVGILAGWRRPALDANVLTSSYVGGIIGIVLVLADLFSSLSSMK